MRKLLIIISTILIIGGGLVFTTGYALNGFDIMVLSTDSKIERKEQTFKEINNIKIDESTNEIKIIKSNTDEYKINYGESEKTKYNIYVDENNNLIIERKKIINFINFISPKNNIILEVPESFNKDLVINTSTGNIDINVDNEINNLYLNFSTADVKISNITCNEMIIDGSTGDTYISNVEVTNNIEIDLSTGEAEINGLDTTTLKVKVNTNGIDLENIVAETINLEASTGDIDFNNIEFKEMNIKTSTGDVEGSLNHPINNYNITSHCSTGENNLPSKLDGGIYTLNVEVSTGDIEIMFASN